MEGLDWIELVGTLAFFAFSLTLAYVAVSATRFGRYGQEALLAASAFIFTAALMRSLVYVGWLEREQAVFVNSIAAISFILIGGQLAILRYVSEHAQQQERRE